MDERDLEPEQPRVRLGVDKLRALAFQRLQGDVDVSNLERDMVHTGAARGEKSADRRVLLQRREQLDPAAADEDGCGLDSLFRHRRPVLELRAEQPLVRTERFLEVRNGHA
jgi:hypothetical protein